MFGGSSDQPVILATGGYKRAFEDDPPRREPTPRRLGNNDVIIPGNLLLATTSIPIPTESTQGVVSRWEKGYGNSYGAYAEVEYGTNATVDFDLTVTAYFESDYTSVISNITSNMTASERSNYDRVTQSYGGGVGGVLGWFGFRAGGSYTSDSINQARQQDSHYEQHSNVVGKAIKDVKSQRLRISGRLTATGVSQLPQRVRAWIQVTTITMQDGTKKTVISETPSVVAANDQGVTAQSGGAQVNVQPLGQSS